MAGSVTSTIDALTKISDPYTATASIGDSGAIDTTSSKVTGDRTSGLFAESAKSLGKDDFLMLLVKQMQCQDPLSPTENTEFIAQLAQFTALENSNNMGTAIEDLNKSFQSSITAQQSSAQSMTNASAVSLIGKEVRLKQSTVTWDGVTGKSATLNVNLGNNSSAVVQIVDDKGSVVKSIQTSGKDSDNSSTVAWDGSTDAGSMAPQGTYAIQFQDGDTHPELYAYVQNVVEGIRFGNNGAMVKVDGKEITVSNVLDVSGTGTATGSQSAGSLSPSTAVALLGKQVRMRETSVQYHQQDNENVAVDVAAGKREFVNISLVDSAGKVAYSTSTRVGSDGIAHFAWNGQQVDGTQAAAGTYQIRITGEAQDSSLYAFTEGVVSGIANLNGDTRLRVGTSTVQLSNIIDIADVSGTES